MGRLINLSQQHWGNRRLKPCFFFFKRYGLSNLTYLNLNSNQITDISPLQGLIKLKKLILIENKIKQLPETILELGLDIDVDSDSDDVIKSNKNAIFLVGNPLEKPLIEIIRQGKETIRAYFKSLEGKKVKLLPVDDGDVGKTSMVKRLLNDSKEKEHTASDQKLKEIKRLSKKIEQLKIDLQKEKKLKELCDGEAEKKARRLEIEKKKQYTLHRFSMEEYTRLNRDMENAQRLHQQLLE